MIGASCKESSSFRTKSGTRSTYIEWPGRPIRPLNPSTRAAGLAARPVWSARRTGTCAQKLKCQFHSFDTSPTGGTRRLFSTTLADLVTWFESETHCSRIPEKLVVNFNEKKLLEEFSLISDWSIHFCPDFTIERLGLVLLAVILSIFSALHFRGVEHKEKTSIKRFIPPLLLWDARSRAPLPRPTPHAYATLNVNQIKRNSLQHNIYASL